MSSDVKKNITSLQNHTFTTIHDIGEIRRDIGEIRRDIEAIKKKIDLVPVDTTARLRRIETIIDDFATKITSLQNHTFTTIRDIGEIRRDIEAIKNKTDLVPVDTTARLMGMDAIIDIKQREIQILNLNLNQLNLNIQNTMQDISSRLMYLEQNVRPLFDLLNEDPLSDEE